MSGIPGTVEGINDAHVLDGVFEGGLVYLSGKDLRFEGFCLFSVLIADREIFNDFKAPVVGCTVVKKYPAGYLIGCIEGNLDFYSLF